MSTDSNVALVRRFVDEVINGGHLDLVDEFFAPDFVNHSPNFGSAPDREGLKQLLGALRAAFPDAVMRVEDVVAAGDKVMIRFTSDGTQAAEFAGIPPAGRRLQARGFSLARIADGRVVERWNVQDNLETPQSLGAVVSYPTSTEGRASEQGTPSTIDKNKAVVRHMLEDLLNGNRPDLVGEVFSPEIQAGGVAVGLERVGQAISHHHAEFSGFQYIIDELIGEGDTVVVRGYFRGTQTGEIRAGGLTIAPTGKPVECHVFDLYRLRDERIIEEIAMGDTLGLFQQLGFVSVQATPAEATSQPEEVPH